VSRSARTAPGATRKFHPSYATSREKNPVILTLEIILGITSLLLLLFILLHKGKGGGLSDMFGGGFTSQHGGSSVVEKNLDRITIVLSVVWLACIVGIGIAYK
jgi:preprotein translocase subunit SecG